MQNNKVYFYSLFGFECYETFVFCGLIYIGRYLVGSIVIKCNILMAHMS